MSGPLYTWIAHDTDPEREHSLVVEWATARTEVVLRLGPDGDPTTVVVSLADLMAIVVHLTAVAQASGIDIRSLIPRQRNTDGSGTGPWVTVS